MPRHYGHSGSGLAHRKKYSTTPLLTTRLNVRQDYILNPIELIIRLQVSILPHLVSLMNLSEIIALSTDDAGPSKGNPDP